jgi:hypothetical protein
MPAADDIVLDEGYWLDFPSALFRASSPRSSRFAKFFAQQPREHGEKGKHERDDVRKEMTRPGNEKSEER